MPITALGYLGVRSDRLEDWGDFAGGLLGMQRIDRAGHQLAFRMDDRQQRLVVTNEPGDALAYMGWEVLGADDLDTFAARLSDAGHPVTLGSRELADRRFVEGLITTRDPAGNHIELFHGPMVTDALFVPGRPISGFKTGPFGMGHAVLHVKDAKSLLSFYRDVLGFAVSDYGLDPIPMYFFHVNGRHHSFAIIGTGQEGFHHFMVEYTNLDDVGQGYDLAQNRDKVAFTLGRHTNDWATSYYAHTPSGFFVESGWGVRVIEPSAWEPEEMRDGPSLWGHDRPYLPDELRQKYTDMRLANGAKGLQAPPPTDCPWLHGVLTGR
ncbi:MAG: VOC family protein [Pseudomonadota bacterium]